MLEQDEYQRQRLESCERAGAEAYTGRKGLRDCVRVKREALPRELLCHQEPAGQPLLDRMHGITGRGLRDAPGERLCEGALEF